MRAVLIRKSTQEIIKKSNYPKLDIEPIIGLDPDLEWLLVNIEDKPIYDPSIEKIERVEEITTEAHPDYPALNQYKVYWNVVPLTQEEIDNYTQQQEDNDNAALKIQKYKSDGIIGFDRAYALIQRRFDNGVITGNQAKAIAQGLYPSLEPLYKGLWQLVKANLDSETPPTNAKLLDIFNKIKTGVDNYVANNY